MYKERTRVILRIRKNCANVDFTKILHDSWKIYEEEIGYDKNRYYKVEVWLEIIYN